MHESIKLCQEYPIYLIFISLRLRTHCYDDIITIDNWIKELKYHIDLVEKAFIQYPTYFTAALLIPNQLMLEAKRINYLLEQNITKVVNSLCDININYLVSFFKYLDSICLGKISYKILTTLLNKKHFLENVYLSNIGQLVCLMKYLNSNKIARSTQQILDKYLANDLIEKIKYSSLNEILEFFNYINDSVRSNILDIITNKSSFVDTSSPECIGSFLKYLVKNGYNHEAQNIVNKVINDVSDQEFTLLICKWKHTSHIASLYTSIIKSDLSINSDKRLALKMRMTSK